MNNHRKGINNRFNLQICYDLKFRTLTEPSLKLFIDKTVSLTEIYYRNTFGNSFDLIEFIQLFVIFTTCHKYHILIYGCKEKDLSAIYLERN